MTTGGEHHCRASVEMRSQFGEPQLIFVEHISPDNFLHGSRFSVEYLCVLFHILSEPVNTPDSGDVVADDVETRVLVDQAAHSLDDMSLDHVVHDQK